MSSGLFRWVDVDGAFRLAIMPRPPGGQRLDSALRLLHRDGVQVIASLQPEAEAVRCDLEREPDAAELVGMRFVRFPIDDHGVPRSPEAARATAEDLHDELVAGRGVLLHCYAGIGRSGLMAILILTRAGFDLEDAANRVSAARELRVPETESQWFWLNEHRFVRGDDG
jgi:protein-tyrosine phosphatase